MSTIWRGLCLSHDPVIEFDCPYASGDSLTAECARLSWLSSVHANCDVMLGGFSYPLVKVACPCSKHRIPKVWDVTELRLAFAAWGTDVAQEWLRRNNCWTIERLSKVLGGQEPARVGSRLALEQALSHAGWALEAIEQTAGRGNTRTVLWVYPRSTTNNEGE